jgi:ATP-dependent helicase/nuclease subunit A
MRRTPQFECFNASQRHALDSCRNLAVRANAGSGKTSVVVERIVQLLAKSWNEAAPLELSSIVAITFTRKAAAELQERLAESFQQLLHATSDPSEQAYWEARLGELPRAMVGTIDSFCARILREFGFLVKGSERIEPDFEPFEGYEEAVLKREAINRVINQLSSLSPDRGDSEQQAQVEACRRWAVEDGYDTLVGHLEVLLNHSLDPETIVAAHQDLPAATQRVAEDWAALPVVQRLERERDSLLVQLRNLESAIAACKKPGSSLLELQARVRNVLSKLESSSPRNDEAALRALAETLLTEKGTPRKQGLAAVATHVLPLQDDWCPLLERFDFDYDGEVHAREAADRLVTLLAPVHAEYLRLCRLSNRFDFLTLARRTRDLLQTHPEVRERLKQRWRYVMVDEFQDTNELQWEILSWIVGSGPDGPLDSDRFFIVGDPQQSIYRFRHADVAVFARVQERIRASNQQHGHAERPTLYDLFAEGPFSTEQQRLGLMPLAENYRSLSPMPLDLMDRVFRHVFNPLAHGLDLEQNAFEVRYQPLQAGLKKDKVAVGEVRYVIPFEQADEDPNEEGAAGEPEEQAPAGDTLGRLQVRAVVDQLIELHGRPKYAARPGEPQTLAWRDMAVLLPSRSTVLIELEKEFRRRQVPFVVTKGIGFWQRQEIRDVTNLATCLADTGDELALFAVLRSPLGQLSDAEILFLSQLGESSLLRGLHYVVLAGDDLSVPAASEPASHECARERWENLPPPVQAALSVVWREFPRQSKERLRRTAARLGNRPPGSWRQRVDRMAHADLLQRCLEESSAYAILAADPDGESLLANLERLFDLIRAEETQSAAGLARLARWLRQHMDDSLKEEQATVAPGTDAVQIMTVHAAKGLEFPVVAIMKMERKVDRYSHPRLLVRNAGDRLLPCHPTRLTQPRPGTVAVKVRHPRRPRETYAPCLFKALQRLDQAQQLAESRRLFYVAATRAKERLILAGREKGTVPLRREGQSPFPGRLRQSWQKWFEEALGITEEHQAKNVWQDPAQGHVVQIITGASAGDPIEGTKPTAPEPRMALDYVHERPQSPTLATTSLEQMRQKWKTQPWEWWLKYRVQLDAQVSLPSIGTRSRASHPGGGQLGTVIGTLVHRLFEMPGALQQQTPAAFRKLLEAMAAGLLVSPSPLDDVGEEESPMLADPETVRVVAAAVEQIWGRLQKATGNEVRELLEAAGETEVPFVLRLGRWQISGRYDKLLASSGGFEIVDWKTDREAEPEIIARRHEPQMRLYALALHRAGLAALVEGKVRVHLAMLHPLRVKPLCFSPRDLEAFANELAHELQQMDAY